ncbi:hypothetical protein [Hyunsoonleella flava]|nr:hypothetical protein [Hyunsoonleella flava]
MLKLFTDTSFLTEQYRSKLFPLLFELVFKENESLMQCYKIVDDIKSAHIVVLPIDYSTFYSTSRKAFTELNTIARAHHKTIWTFTAGDYGFTTHIPNMYTFRSGGFDSKLNNKTFILPAFINDPYNSFLKQGFSPLKKQTKPSIGFVGHAKSGILKYLKEYMNFLKFKFERTFKNKLADKQSFYPSSVKRAKYLREIAQNKNLNTQFVLRNKYRAGLNSKLTQTETSKVFYENIYENAYTFCLRGVGNFSVRFYETLAVGRIPVVINTDCRFPLDHKVDWFKHCLIIDKNSKKPVSQHILEFHNSLTDNQFEAMQVSNRNMWLNTLNKEAFFLEIYELFKSELK